LNYTIVRNAVRYKCSKVQFCKLFLTQKMIDDAHKQGLVCNLFWADDPEEALEFTKIGINTILTNNFLAVKRAFSNQ
jgi:glycerophosphoryl diester phosphodiesterase